MKKLLFILVFALMAIITTNAQIKVDSNGGISIGSTVAPPANTVKVFKPTIFDQNVTLPDYKKILIGDASKGNYLWSDGTYMKFSKAGTSASSFYITDDIPVTYIYSPHTYLGSASGDQIHLRGNMLDGNGWSISGAGSINANGSLNIGAITSNGTLIHSGELVHTGGVNKYASFYNFESFDIVADYGYFYGYDFEFISDVWVNGSFTEYSDKKLKENIKPLKLNATEKINSLKPVEFKFKEKEGKHLGFIAQDVQEIIPELVSSKTNKEGEEILGIKTLELIPYLVKAIQEQQEKIEELEARVEKLEKK